MRIGIDISQLAYPNTGVANYLFQLVDHMVKQDSKNEYILFFSSLRGRLGNEYNGLHTYPNVTLKTFRFPSKLLDLVWNRLHKFPIENLIGAVDLFITSDWTEPPTKRARKATIIYDMVVYKFPEETADLIRKVQMRKHEWVRKETAQVLTISESAKKDITDLTGIESSKVKVMYPGI